MRGSIIKRKSKSRIDGKFVDLYYVVYQIGSRQKWEAVDEPRTRKHAEELLAERLSQINRGEYIEPKKTTFEEFKEVWVKKYAETQVRLSTMALYDSLFNKHLIPAFGPLQVARITVEDVQGLKSVKMKEGLSPQTVKHILRLLRQMLNHAVDWGYLRTNPAAKVRYPRIPKAEMDCLTPDEIRLFLEHVSEQWYPFFLIAIATGLRLGEQLAMKWANLDWNRGQYFVKETILIARQGRPAGIGEPKTESSIAPVDLTPLCLEAITEHRRRQATEKLKAGEKYQDHDLIFATPKGTPLDHRNIVRRVLEPALTEAGLRIIRFHDLRHTCASLLIDQGESPKYVQKQMRHASIQITFDRYGHLFEDTNREAGKRLDETVFRSKENLRADRNIGFSGDFST